MLLSLYNNGMDLMNDILTAIYFNFIPIALIGFGSWIFVELVKYEHNRKSDGK